MGFVAVPSRPAENEGDPVVLPGSVKGAHVREDNRLTGGVCTLVQPTMNFRSTLTARLLIGINITIEV